MFSFFFFFCQKLVFEFEISSFLLSALKNKSLPIFENKQIILSRSITFSAFFVVKLFFHCYGFGNNYPNLFCFGFEISSFLLPAFKNKSLPIFENKQIILSRSITFSPFFFFVKNLYLSLRSLLSCSQHSRTNHCLYLRTKQIILSRSITFLLFFFVVRNMFFSL